MTDFHYSSERATSIQKPHNKTTHKSFLRENVQERKTGKEAEWKFHLNAFIHPSYWWRSPIYPIVQMHVTFLFLSGSTRHVNMFILIYSSEMAFQTSQTSMVNVSLSLSISLFPFFILPSFSTCNSIYSMSHYHISYRVGYTSVNTFHFTQWIQWQLECLYWKWNELFFFSHVK